MEPKPTALFLSIAMALAETCAQRVRSGEQPPQSVTVMYGEDAEGHAAVHVMAWLDGQPSDTALVRI